MKSKKYQLLSYWYIKNKTLVSILKFTVIPTRKCLKKEKYCKSTNETGERVGRKKCKNWGIGRKCWLLRADITRSRQHCSSSWWSFMALNIRDPEMCNEPQKCRCLLMCCWKMYPRSFLIAWKISWSCYFTTAKSGCREKTIGTACGGKWHDIVYEWNIKRTRAYKAWQPPPLTQDFEMCISTCRCII